MPKIMPSNTVKHVVTGSSGFIGRRLTRWLISQGCQVGTWSHAQVNLLNRDSIAEAVKNYKPRIIYHLASTGVTVTRAHTADVVKDDVTMLANLMEVLEPRSTLVIAGTMAEYGRSGVLKENDCCMPKTAYGVAKLACSTYALAYGSLWSLNVRIGRIFGAYGIGEHGTRLFPTLIQGVKAGQPVALSDGEQVRDFIHVDDVCEALARLGQLPENTNVVINVGTGKGVRVRDAARWVTKALGGEEGLLHFGARPRSPADEDVLVADVVRLNECLGWCPPQRLGPGLNVADLFIGR
jgi:nucleoside-diphosphate-sugar epimerase